MDRELLMVALSFWCSATNTMVLLLGLMGPTILDVTAILDTSPSGLPIDTAFSRYQFDLDLKMVLKERTCEVLKRKDQEVPNDEANKLYKNFFNYITLITHFAGQDKSGLKKGEHEAFLFYLYNNFIFCTKSNKCLAENMPVAEALTSGHQLVLNPTIHANFTRLLTEATVEKIDPLWVFQFWLQVYFTTLKLECFDFNPLETMGLYLAS